MNRRLISIILLLALTVPGLVAFAPARQGSSDIDLAISAGLNGYFRKGSWVAVRVTVSNAGDNLDGEIRVRTGRLSGLAETTYRTPLDLPGGARKQVFLYISLESYSQKLQVELVNEHAYVVKRAETTLQMVSASDSLYAVISESPYGTVDLAAVDPGIGQGYLVTWRIEDIPPLAEALVGLDVMMFHDVDTGTLQAEQVDAITNWVLSGGHLIVTGGDSWQRTTAGFRDLLPVSLEGTVPVSSLTDLAGYLRLPSEALNVETTVTRSTPDLLARTLVSAEGVPLVVRGEYGGGVVDFVAVDPNNEPLRSWDGTERLWHTLITSTGQRPSWASGFQDWPIGRDATRTTSSTALPTFLQLCGFLALYIVLVGPINYLLLKRLNRREMAWFTIPLLILVFSVLAYKVGFNLRGNVTTINRLTVVRAWADSDQAEVNSLIGVQSPRRSTYDVAVERGYSLRTLPGEGIGLNVPSTISEGTRFIAESIPIDAGMIASFAASGYAAVPYLDAEATWHLGPTQAADVSGYVTNTTDMVLGDAVILIKGAKRSLGTLQPGETQTFSINVGAQDPGPAALGNPLDEYSYYSPNLTWQYRQALGGCFSPQGLYVTLPDIMGEKTFPCSSGPIGAGGQETRRRFRLLGSLVIDRDLSGGRGSGVFLAAWTDTGVIQTDAVNKPQVTEDTTLYIFELPVTVAAVTTSLQVQVPSALTTWSIIETDNPATLRDVSPTQFRLGSKGQAAFEFMPMPDMRLSSVDDLTLRFHGQGLLRVEIWNWYAEVWVEVIFDPDATEYLITDPHEYVGPENAVHVRVIAGEATTYYQVDYVKVSYSGQLAKQGAPTGQVRR
ncbi:MAG: hypothetical protein JXJ20_08250 [Anaerolineae bacterium]|nr:hypothetical protein [Anaerolineae bacterium]